MPEVTVGAARALIQQLHDPLYADYAIGVLRQWMAEEQGGALAFDHDAKLLLQPYVDTLAHD